VLAGRVKSWGRRQGGQGCPRQRALDLARSGRHMTKSKATLIAAITFVVTTGFMVLLCANSHIDFFPCKQTVRDRVNADPFTGEARLITRDGTCSLSGHLREGFDGEKDELTEVGWAMLAAFCMGIGLADSALLYVVLTRKSSGSKSA
jgi:hypothetical protein